MAHFKDEHSEFDSFQNHDNQELNSKNTVIMNWSNHFEHLQETEIGYLLSSLENVNGIFGDYIKRSNVFCNKKDAEVKAKVV